MSGPEAKWLHDSTRRLDLYVIRCIDGEVLVYDRPAFPSEEALAEHGGLAWGPIPVEQIVAMYHGLKRFTVWDIIEK